MFIKQILTSNIIDRGRCFNVNKKNTGRQKRKEEGEIKREKAKEIMKEK